jgi:hypothetical protein
VAALQAVLAALSEAVVRLSGWHRLPVLLAVFTAGNLLAAWAGGRRAARARSAGPVR